MREEAQCVIVGGGANKESGVGRELGPWGIESYLEEKQLYIKLT